MNGTTTTHRRPRGNPRAFFGNLSKARHDPLVLFVSRANNPLEKYLMDPLINTTRFKQALKLAEQLENRKQGISTPIAYIHTFEDEKEEEAEDEMEIEDFFTA